MYQNSQRDRNAPLLAMQHTTKHSSVLPLIECAALASWGTIQNEWHSNVIMHLMCIAVMLMLPKHTAAKKM